jgi:ABC-type lipoprotein release transport system permease subunit
MLETLIVLGVVAAMVAAGLVVLSIPAGVLLLAGLLCSLLGLLVGVPAGFWYHVRLRRALLRRPPLPERWWLHPTRFHGELGPAERKPVMPWFYLGAVSFMVCMLGALLAMLGVLRAL